MDHHLLAVKELQIAARDHPGSVCSFGWKAEGLNSSISLVLSPGVVLPKRYIDTLVPSISQLNAFKLITQSFLF